MNAYKITVYNFKTGKYRRVKLNANNMHEAIGKVLETCEYCEQVFGAIEKRGKEN